MFKMSNIQILKKCLIFKLIFVKFITLFLKLILEYWTFKKKSIIYKKMSNIPNYSILDIFLILEYLDVRKNVIHERLNFVLTLSFSEKLEIFLKLSF